MFNNLWFVMRYFCNAGNGCIIIINNSSLNVRDLLS